MHPRSFKSKRYALAVLVSISLLSTSFLSTEARAGSLESLKTKATEWKKERKGFNIYEVATALNLRVTETRNIQDLGTKKNKQVVASRAFVPTDLESEDRKVQHLARVQNAKLEIFRRLLEQPTFEQSIENRIKQGDFLDLRGKELEEPAFKKAAEDLNITYNPKKLIDKDKQVRHEEKNKKIIIEEYIQMVRYASLDRQVSKWIEEDYIPKKSDFEKMGFFDKFNTRQKIDFIKSEVEKKSNNSKGETAKVESNTQKILARIRSSFRSNNKSGKPPINPKPQNNPSKLKKSEPTFDFRGSISSLLNKQETNLTETEKKLKQQIELDKIKEEFDEVLKKNPVEALNLANQKDLDSSLKQDAVNAVLTNLNDETLQKLLLNKTDLNQVLANCSDEQKRVVIEKSKAYAVQALPASMSNSSLNGKTKLMFATLAAEDKTVLEESLYNLLNNKGYKRKPEVDELLSLLLLDEEKLEEKINKIFETPVNNVQNQKNGSTPPPPPPPMFGLDLNKLNTQYPELGKLYDKFIQNKVPVTSSNSEIPKTIVEPRAEMAKSLALINQKKAKQDEIITSIRNKITESYAFTPETLVGLFAAENDAIVQKVKEQISDMQKTLDEHNIKATETFLSRVFNESLDEAEQRIISLETISDEQKKQVKQHVKLQQYKIESAKTVNPVDQLKFAYNQANILGQDIFDSKLQEFIENPNKLNIPQKINFILQGYKELTKENSLAKPNLDILKQNILAEIEIKQLLGNKDLNQKDLLEIIKNKDPKILNELLEAKVVLEESKAKGLNIQESDLRKIAPSLSDLTFTQLTTLVNRVPIDGIKITLKNSWEEKNNTKTAQKIQVGNNNIPVPPPPPPPSLLYSSNVPKPPPPPVENSNSSANDYLIGSGISPSLIDRMGKLKPKNIFSKKNIPNDEAPKFSSNAAQKYYKSSSNLGGKDMLLSNSQKLDIAIKEEVLTRYIAADPNRRVDSLALEQAFKEKFVYDENHASDVNFDQNFIGPRTEIGQEIFELYEQESLKLVQDSEFIKYVENKEENKKDEKVVLVNFVKQLQAKKPELEKKYSEVINAPKLKEETKKKDESLNLLGSEDNNKDEDKKEVESTEEETQKKGESSNLLESEGNDKDEDENKKEVESTEEVTNATPQQLNSDNKNVQVINQLSALTDKKDEAEEVIGNKENDNIAEETNDEGYESEIEVETKTEEGKTINDIIDSKVLEEQEKQEIKEQVREKTNSVAALLNNISSKFYEGVHKTFNNRLNSGAIAAGDEDTSITRGVWVSSLFSVSNQGSWKNIPKYNGRTVGLTIGTDMEFANSFDIIGIAYSRIESHFKYNKKLGKTALNGHLLSVYGLKELPKNFSLQGIASFGYNYIKNKTSNIGNIIGKYKNNNFNFETLLNYKYRTKYNIYLVPNIGLKYDYSRNSNYKECDNIQNLMIQKKSNQLLTSSFGAKILFKSIGIVNDITLVPSLHGNIENRFYNKNTKVNAKATFKNQSVEEAVILPKQPGHGYNLGGNVLINRKNINILLEYNYYTHKKYQNHQGLIKLKVNL